jgi:capsular exopolysaccharide synthesis family protein
LFQRFGRPSIRKPDDLPISAEPTGKVQDTFPTLHETAYSLEHTSQAFDKRKKPVQSKRTRLDLQALYREEEIKLVQRVFLSPGAGAPRVVVFSGIGHRCGCSSVCSRAGETLAAQMAGNICVVDANLRSSYLHQYLAVRNTAGLADALVRSGPVRQFTQRVSKGNLWVLTSGLDVSNPHVLLTSDRLRPRIAELRSEFDFVLIDAPPINHYADATLIGELADGVMLVLEADSTRREVARKAKQILAAANVRLIGVVLNKRTFPIPAFIYRKL